VLHLIAKAQVNNPVLDLMHSFIGIPGRQDYRGGREGGVEKTSREGRGRQGNQATGVTSFPGLPKPSLVLLLFAVLLPSDRFDTHTLQSNSTPESAFWNPVSQMFGHVRAEILPDKFVQRFMS